MVVDGLAELQEHELGGRLYELPSGADHLLGRLVEPFESSEMHADVAVGGHRRESGRICERPRGQTEPPLRVVFDPVAVKGLG
jgi:hypothetical protein